MAENDVNNQTPGTESPYGENAVTGSAEDVLKDRDVSITTTDTQKVTIPTEEDVDDKGESDKDDNKDTEDKQTEDKADKKDEDTAESEDSELQTEVNKVTDAANDLRKDLTTKGIDFDAIAEEFSNNGDFTPETRAALEKAGYPQTVVDAFLSGLQATADKIVTTIFSYCGGEDEYNKMAQYIKAQGEDTVAQFNRVLESGDVEQMKLAIDGFKARMGARTGVAGRSVLGGNGTGGNAQKGFSSKSDMVKAMSDPRYGRDPSYTKDIQKKTMNSSFF